MITDAIMDAIDTLISLCKNYQHIAGMRTVQAMLGDFDEDCWMKMSENERAAWAEEFIFTGARKLNEIKTEFDSLAEEYDRDVSIVYLKFCELLMEGNRLFNKSVLWSDGDILLASSAEIADKVADWLDALGACASTGYYDPKYDEEHDLTDERTGYWYIDM